MMGQCWFTVGHNVCIVLYGHKNTFNTKMKSYKVINILIEPSREARIAFLAEDSPEERGGGCKGPGSAPSFLHFSWRTLSRHKHSSSTTSNDYLTRNEDLGVFLFKNLISRFCSSR